MRIISKPHAYLQRMVKTSVNFQKNQSKTVGGVAHTRYILYRGTERQTGGMTESQKLCPSAFLRKGGGQKMTGNNPKQDLVNDDVHNLVRFCQLVLKILRGNKIIT